MFWKRIQIGLIHVAVTMTLVPINSTLNRVMIKELALAATLVALLASLPHLFSPIQIAIGSFSDRRPIFGRRRTPYIVLGLLLCLAGLLATPYAAFQMGEDFWRGLPFGILAFGAWGMGSNFATVAYFSLATEISGEKGRGRTIAIMFFMMIVSIIFTSLGLSRMLADYSPEQLVSAFRVVAVVAAGLGLVGLIGLEPAAGKQGAGAEMGHEERYSIGMLVAAVRENRQVTLFFWYLILLLTAILGQDVLLEPFAAEAFGMPVQATTRITSIWGGFFLLALLAAGVMESRTSKRAVARVGAWGSTAAFVIIAASGLIGSSPTFYVGVVLLGAASGLATVSNLSLMLDMTLPGQVGLFMGAWGMANSLARLVGAVVGGALRDLAGQFVHSPAGGYVIVFLLQALLLVISLFLLRRVDVSAFRANAARLTPLESAALVGEG